MFSFFKKKSKKDDKPSRAEILAQAKENARAASEAIGEDTLAKVREQMMKKEGSEFEQALKKIKSMDQDRIADNIRATYREDK